MGADPVEPAPGTLQLFQHHPGPSVPVVVGNEQHCEEKRARDLKSQHLASSSAKPHPLLCSASLNTTLGAFGAMFWEAGEEQLLNGS